MDNIKELHENLFVYLEELRDSNPGLKYTLRKDNFGNRLQEGFWFLGDNNTILLSFWSGENIYTKQPDISLKFDLVEQQIYLELTVEISQINLGDFSFNKGFFLRKLIDLDIYKYDRMVNYDNYSKYIHTIGELSNWRLLVENFITFERKKIDRELLDFEQDINFVQIIHGGQLGFIDEVEFAISRKKIEKYRKSLAELREFEFSVQDNRRRPFYLSEFEVQNFGPIENVLLEDLPRNNRWIFITGANGSGKSFLLKAIALSLGQGMVPKNYFYKSESPYFKVKLFGTNEGEVTFERKGNDNTSKNAKSSLLGGFAAYGIHRTTIRKNINFLNSVHELSKNGFLESILGERISPLIDFNKTIHEWTNAESSLEKFNNRRDFFVKALLKTVPGLVDIHFVEKKRNYETEFFFKYDDGEVFRVSYEQLSSGSKSTLSFVADIIVRFYKQQPKAYDPSEFRGVVIVDEIDLHLHPQGQKDLIVALSEVFPNIQFIVSTHSPIPLLAAPKNTVVYRIDRSTENGINVKRLDTLIYLEDLLPNAILTSPIFGMNDLVNPIRDTSKRISTEDDYSEIEFSKKLNSRIDDFLTDRKQNELIKLFENRRK